MENKTIKLELNIPINDYNKIQDLINHVNNIKRVDKLLHADISIENFIFGSVRNEIERIEIFNEIFCDLKTRGYIRPIKLKNNFRGILKTMGLKQYDLVEMTGISDSDICNYLNNKKLFSFDHFMRIWISLGCPDLERVFYVKSHKIK